MTGLTEQRLAVIYQPLALLVKDVIKRTDSYFPYYHLEVTAGYRSWPEQAKLYAQGRTTKGDRVTDAKAGQSAHNYGLGVDVAFFNKSGKPDWVVPNVYWQTLQKFIEQAGLRSGADFGDRPHIEVKGFDWRQCQKLYLAQPKEWNDAQRLAIIWKHYDAKI